LLQTALSIFFQEAAIPSCAQGAGTHKLEYQPIADDIRAAIAVGHGVTVRDVLLVQAGSIPRTSSGKIGRRACRTAYLDGSLRSGVNSATTFATSE